MGTTDFTPEVVQRSLALPFAGDAKRFGDGLQEAFTDEMAIVERLRKEDTLAHNNPAKRKGSFNKALSLLDGVPRPNNNNPATSLLPNLVGVLRSRTKVEVTNQRVILSRVVTKLVRSPMPPTAVDGAGGNVPDVWPSLPQLRVEGGEPSPSWLQRGDWPVGARLPHFEANWRTVTTDPWVLSVVM